MYYVYKMIHVPTGRVYVGQRKCPAGKTPETDSYHGSGKVWKRIYNAHPDECVKVVIDTYNSKGDVNQAEIDFIKHYKAVWGDFCVNITDGGEGWCSRHTEASKAKMSATKKAWTPEYRALVSRHISESHPCKGKPAWNRGLHPSEETIKKNSEAHKGKHPSEETRLKMSDAHKGRVSPMKGKSLSDEHRRKISENNYWKGRRRSEETRRKMSEAKKGKASPMKGKHMSDEARKKISDAIKIHWKARKENV